MPISVKAKLVFIHIPKTGGTAVENKMKEVDPNLCLFGATGKVLQAAVAFAGKSYQHFTLDNILRFWAHNETHTAFPALKGLEAKECKFVTVVRNPYTRFASEVRFRFPSKTRITDQNEFLKKVREFACNSFGVWETNPNVWDNHITPQHFFLDSSEVPVEIVKYEDFPTLVGKVPWIPGEERALTINPHYSDAMILTDEIKNMVAKFYAKDFARFNYDI